MKQLLPSSQQNATVLDRLSKVVVEKVAEMDRTIALKGDLHDSQAAAVFRSKAKRLREAAKLLPHGILRETMLRKARQCDTGSHMSDWSRSPGLKVPT